MNKLFRTAAPYLVGAALVAAVVLGVRWYGASRYDAGVAAERAATLERQARLERAMQEEKDRADAQYRGAVLAREAAEKTVAAQRARIDGLLRQLAQRRTQAAGAVGGSDDTGPDWIGVIGACVGEYEQLGKDAARWADQVNGLQGYISAVRQAAPAR
ncbi:hypothetical protein [Bordetella hinzii]|uniref:Uncharacterized protein n=1 Tax=Bordetella hinzii TaxID=103855 RepID=A0AAN1RZX9_9BORD|nr:hypothetical protein [Bordetella hinzii]AZW19129.1 hypothetical protein CS347_21400 [Bordetella hinzii]